MNGLTNRPVLLLGLRFLTQAAVPLVAAVAGLFTLPLSGADIQWSGANSTDWNDPGNWVGGLLPGAGDNAHLDVSGATTDIDQFNDPGFNVTIQQLYVGDANPNATLTQSTGTLSLNGAQAWLKIGAQSGSSGIYNLQGTGIVSLTNDVLGVGEHGIGTFDVSNNAQATAPRMALGRYSEGRGVVFQSGTSTVTVNGSGNDGNGTPNYGLAIGEQSTALSSYTITGGTLSVTTGNILIGMTSGSTGRMTVAGPSVVSAGQETHVGESGTGTLVVNGGQFNAAEQMIVGNTIGGSGSITQGGGAVNLNGGVPLVLGNQGGGVGSYALAGGTLNSSGRILVGEDGQATFTQTGGTNSVTLDLSIADHLGFSTAANPDSYTISAGALTVTGGIQVGRQGFGVVNQSGGIVSTTADVHFGSTVNGNTQTGQGIYNLSGGTLTTPSISAQSTGTAPHQFNFTGGTLKVGNFNTTGVTTILTTLTQTSAANPSLLDVTGQNTTIGANYSISGQNATAVIDNGNMLHVTGIMSIDNHAVVTMAANANNNLTIDGSPGNPNDSLNVGVAGQGQLTINGGTLSVATGDVMIGQNSGGVGVVTQTAGTTSFHAASPNWFFVGSAAGSQGTYNFSGGTLTEPNNEEVGYGGTGTFNQTGGTHTVGNLVLGGQASGTGTFALSGGTLVVHGVSGGPGMSAFDLNGGTLQASGNNAAFFQGMTSAIVQSGGALVNAAGNNIGISQTLLHDPALGATADGGLIKSGAGGLTLSGASTFTGGTTLAAGAIQIAAPITISGGVITAGPVGVKTLTLAGGTLQDDGSTRIIPNNVAIGGNVAFSSPASGSLVFDSTGLSTPSTVALSNNPTFTVTNSVTINDVITGSGQALTKAGGGTLTLGSANSYSGPTAVNGGVLRVSGSLTAASAVTVNSGGLLSGTGTIGGSVGVAGGGHLAPGGAAAVGTLTTGPLTLNAGSILDEILGTPGAGAPSVGDKSTLAAVLGTLTLPTSGTISVNLADNAGAGGNGSFGNGTYTLFTYSTLSGGNVTFNNTFTIGSAPVGKLYTFSNTGTSNGEIDLTVVTAPSAKTWSGAINGNWDTTTANWQGGNLFVANDTPTFDDSATGTTTIAVASGITAGAMTFNDSTKNYSIGGAAIGGAGSLTKTGAGILTLSAPNAYTGGTIVNAGTLRVTNSTGSATGPNSVIIDGGELAGSGAIGGATTVNAGASLAPSFTGGVASALTINNSLTLANNAQLDDRLNSPGQANGAGGNDFVNATGTLTLGTSLELNVIPGASYGNGVYHLLGYGSLNNAGNFAGWSVGLQGTPASLGVHDYSFSNNTANHSVDLTVAAPSSNLLLRYSFHDFNAASNPTVADTSGGHFTGTTLRNTNPADVATAAGPDGLPAIHLTKDDNLGNINGGTATTGSGITTSTQANPALNNPSPGPTTQTFNITNGPFTATAWVKIDNLPQNSPNPAVFQVVFGTPPNSSSDATGSLHMGFRNNQPYLGFYGNDVSNAPALSSAYQGTWFHVAFRYNPATAGNPSLVASRQTIFINGGDGVTPGDAQVYAVHDNSAAYGQIRTLLIGRTIGSGTFVGAFGGSLADVRVYGSALTNAQVALVAAPAGTVYDWNSAAATDWTNSANWTSTYAQPGPPGLGIADVAEFGDPAKQTIAAGNTISLNGAQQIAQLINMNANSWTLASGTAAGTNASPLILREISQRGAGTLTITSGLMIDDTNLLTFDSTTAGSVVMAGPIFDTAAGLTKTSTGVLTLSGNNTYGGTTTVSAGTLRLGAPTLLNGSTLFSSPVGTGPLILASGTTLQDDGAARSLANAVVITGNVTFSSAGAGSITIDSAGLTTPTSAALSNNPILTVTNTTTINSVIAGPGQSLTLAGGGSLILGGNNTYSGGTTVTSGTLTTTASGAVGPGPLSVNATTGNVSTVNLGNSQTVSALSSAVSGGTATLTIAAPVMLTVNQSTNTNFVGTLVNSGTLVKSGGGTLEFDAPPTLGANSSLQVNAGRVRFSTSAPAAVSTGVTATIGVGATMELAGSASALSWGANRVNILNSSQLAGGALLVTGANQQVGNIGGSGNVNVNAGASLTANHIIQTALLIGGAMGSVATVVIAPSDASGNPLIDGSSDLALAGQFTPSEPLMVGSLSATGNPLSPPDTASAYDSAPSTLSVPEPASFILMGLAAALVAAASSRRCAIGESKWRR